jgi:hypothetical protein
MGSLVPAGVARAANSTSFHDLLLTPSCDSPLSRAREKSQEAMFVRQREMEKLAALRKKSEADIKAQEDKIVRLPSLFLRVAPCLLGVARPSSRESSADRCRTGSRRRAPDSRATL